MASLDNVTVVPEGEHSPLGPSSSKRWILCPGSVNASAGAPDDESVYAAEGTAAHYLSELCRREKLPAINWLGHTFKVGKHKFEVDEEMADSVQQFVDWCAEQQGAPLIEQRINYSAHIPATVIDKYGEAFGTLDDARLCDEDVYITDFKHGKGVQEFAEENTQLMLQALGVWAAFNWLYDIKGFYLQISQPRLSHFDKWHISIINLLNWAAEKLPEYAEAILQGTEFKAGEHCKFCRIRRKCAVRLNSGIQSVLGDPNEFEDLDAADTQVVALRAQNRLQHITNERLAQVLPSLDAFAQCIKDLKARAVAALIAGEDLGGWKLVAGRAGSRRFNDEKLAVDKLKSLGVEPYKPPELISVAVAEKELGKANFARRFKEHEDFTKPQGKPKLAPPSDKRPAVDVKLVEFDNLDEQE